MLIFQVVPKNRDGLQRLSNARSDQKAILGHLLFTAQEIARTQGLERDGFRIVINDGKNAGQTVFHLHVHIVGGREMSWPPG